MGFWGDGVGFGFVFGGGGSWSWAIGLEVTDGEDEEPTFRTRVESDWAIRTTLKNKKTGAAARNGASFRTSLKSFLYITNPFMLPAQFPVAGQPPSSLLDACLQHDGWRRIVPSSK
jgi:hypothetical protein